MRILIVTPDYPPPPGGIQTLTRGLETGLERHGHTVAVVESDPKPFATQYLFTRPTLSPTRLGGAKQLLRYPYFNHCYRRVVARIDNFEPDVVHVLHRVNWPALLAAERAGLPSVLTAHALELRERRATRHAADLATRVHAVSDFTAGLVSDVTSLFPADIAVIPPGIDIGTYRRSDRPSPAPDAPVVSIARLVSRKNLRPLLEAWKLTDRSISGERTLVVAGDGPERADLERRFAGERVSFRGWVSEAEKRSLLASAALFALVPRREEFDVEGFGIGFIEAQAAGVPVVGSRTGGVPEAVGDGGVLVDDESDPEAIASAMEALLADTPRRRGALRDIDARIGQFDVEPIAAKHLRNYSSLADATPPCSLWPSSVG